MDCITHPMVEAYIEKLIVQKEPLYREMEKYASDNHVPIIQKASLRLIETLLIGHDIHDIVEIGTAIGYSSLNFCRILEGRCRITTFERNEKRYKTALDFIARSSYNEKIDVVFTDAAEGLDLGDHAYDMAFIDAAKGQYRYFFDRIFPHIRRGGLIISDNIFFRGQVCEDTQLNVTRRNRTIYRRMNDYLSYLMKQEDEFYSTLVPIGDGMAITYKK